MLSGPFISGRFPRGTLIAEIGLLVTAVYYLHAWRCLRSSELTNNPDTRALFGRHSWPELRYLQWGGFSSVLLFMLAGAADEENDWLFRLVGALMGFCAALFFAMFAVGFVALWSLWSQLVWQLKRARIGPLLVSSPLAIVWLGLGLGVFLMFGILLEKIEKLAPFLRFLLLKPLLALIWLSLFKMLDSLCAARSYAALMLPLILMVSFSAIMIVAVAFGYWWIIGQTTLLLVLFLSAIGALNLAFLRSLGASHSVER